MPNELGLTNWTTTDEALEKETGKLLPGF